ncbi:MAG TPA: M14 family zinc carboxypeptidase [Bacteroidota bacterium]|nr:M14 family zinc carboxypeptidase [Bacteroidota bacterium]
MKQLAALLFVVAAASAQQSFELLPGSSYNPAIPSPQSVLRYDIGDRFTDYRNLEKFYDKLVASSDRIQRIVYGETYEMRPLQLLIISSPKNLARLDEIKANNKKLTDPRTFRSKAEAEQIINSLPAIVWLSYGVHGNEACSPEAAMLTAYQLCAGTDQRTLDILENVIVLIDPAVNPDGRERYVQWVNSTLGSKPNVNPDAIEHSEPWPGGRTNHYYFDLNRDWAWQTQKETRARIPLYREWMPHTHVDFHEMGHTSTYFFFPAAPPVHTELPPEVKKWGMIYGKGNAEALQKIGQQYYVGESFDLYYPAYGDSWPTFNGAIGMTYEQAGGSRGSFAVRKPNGDTLTLRQRALNHFTTGIATLETTVKYKKERLQDFFAFWESGLKNASRVKGFIIKEGNDPNRAARLAATLINQGIEVHQLQEATTLEAQRYFTAKPTKVSFPKGTYFISTLQPHSRLVKALLEPKTVLPDTFFYDVSAWSLPVAYGLEAYTTEAPLPSSAKKIAAIQRVAGRVIGGKAAFAYLIPWERNDAVKLVWSLLEKGYAVHYASRPFQTVGRHFRAGTIIVFSSPKQETLHTDITQLAETFGVDVYSAHTGLTDGGISLGSNYVRPIKKPSIAIVTDMPASSNAYGELWYLFDQEYGVPMSAIRGRELGDINLYKYDVLIIPDGGDYRPVLDSSKVAKLKQWVQNGGVLVGIEGGALFLTKSRSGITAALLESEKKEDDKTKEEKEEEKARKEAQKRETQFERQERERLESIPGAIFKALIDTTHPIGFGYDREVYVLKRNSTPFLLSEGALNVGRFAPDSTEASGYAAKTRAKKVADAAFITEFRNGRGRVVLMTESVTFRMFWIGLQKLLFNTVFFLPQPE